MPRGRRFSSMLVALPLTLTLGAPATAAPERDAVTTVTVVDTGIEANRADDALNAMAKLFASAITDERLRRRIHEGAAKRFDGDTNVLYSTLAEEAGVKAALSTQYGRERRVEMGAAIDAVDRLANSIPRFQVAVPAKFADWDPRSYVPLVGYMPTAVEDTTLETITAYDADGREYQLDAQRAPDRPVIVLGVNERTNNAGVLRRSLITAGSARTAGPTDFTASAASYAVEMGAAAVVNSREPWTKGGAEMSFRARSRGCVGVNHTDYDVTGLDYPEDYRSWSGGLELGTTSCPVIFYWWEDDSDAFDFTLSYGKFSLGIKMADGDDLIGGHQHALAEFAGSSQEWYYGLDDIDYNVN